MSQLKEFVGSIVNSFLGPNKSNKFLIEGKDIRIVRCPLYIFQNTHLQDPVSSLVEETLFAHHDLYGCSTLSLLAMWYLWNEEFRLALAEGCEMQNVIKHSQNILELVISSLSDIVVSVDKLLFKERSHEKVTNKIQVPKSIRYSSRHFSPSQFEDDCTLDSSSKLDENHLKIFIQNLVHDEDPEVCDLVLECWKRQTSSIKFQTDGLLICPIILPRACSTVVDGLVIKSNFYHSCFKDRKKSDTKRILIIKGGITYEYVHLGFCPKISVSVKQTSVTTTKKEDWRQKTCEFIKQLNLNALLIKDDIDPEIASFCSVHSVLVLAQIPLKAFKMLCNALQYSPCTYMWDCKEENVIRNLNVREWKPSKDISLDDQYFQISVHFENTLQTVVICHPSEAVLENKKHQMLHLLFWLSSSLQSKKLLPGGGECEEWCNKFLRKLPQFHNPHDPISRIIDAVSTGYQNYSTLISRKKSLSACDVPKVLDEMSSKVNAWRSALSLVLLTLQCDTAIINGLGDLTTKDYTNLNLKRL